MGRYFMSCTVYFVQSFEYVDVCVNMVEYDLITTKVTKKKFIEFILILYHK